MYSILCLQPVCVNYSRLHRPVKVTLIDHRQISQEHPSSSDVTPSKSPSDASADSLAHTVKEKLFIETHSDTSHVVGDRMGGGGGTDGGDGELPSSHASSLTSSTSADMCLPENAQEDCDDSDVQPVRQTAQDTTSSASLKTRPRIGASAKESSTRHHAPSPQGDNPLLHAYRVLSEWCQPETCRLLGEGWNERDASRLSYTEASLVERQQKDRVVQHVTHTDDSSQPEGACGGVQETHQLPVRCLLHVELSFFLFLEMWIDALLACYTIHTLRLQ